MNNISGHIKCESTGGAKHLVPGPMEIAREHLALLQSIRWPPLPHMKQYYNGQHM